MVWALVGMDAIMSAQVGFAIERLVELVNYLRTGDGLVVTFPHLSHEQLNPREPPGAMLVLNCVCCEIVQLCNNVVAKVLMKRQENLYVEE